MAGSAGQMHEGHKYFREKQMVTEAEEMAATKVWDDRTDLLMSKYIYAAAALDPLHLKDGKNLSEVPKIYLESLQEVVREEFPQIDTPDLGSRVPVDGPEIRALHEINGDCGGSECPALLGECSENEPEGLVHVLFCQGAGHRRGVRNHR